VSVPSDVRICSATGLALVPAATKTVFRLAKPSFGPVNSRRRSSSLDDRATWNRFDLPGKQTFYASSTPEGAYGELLGSLKRPASLPAAELFDDAGGATVEELIAEDWVAAGKRLPPYAVDVNWLYEFRLYTVTLPEQGWLVECEHSRTVAFLQDSIPAALLQRGMEQVTVADLRSEDRFVTSSLAERLASVRLDEGRKAIGLRYGSKHGSDWVCWAVWLRDSVADAITVDEGRSILPPDRNAALRKVLGTFNLAAR
jgi:hypothetical protein